MTVQSVAYSFNITGSASKAKITFELTTLSPDELELSVKPENLKKKVSLHGGGGALAMQQIPRMMNSQMVVFIQCLRRTS